MSGNQPSWKDGRGLFPPFQIPASAPLRFDKPQIIGGIKRRFDDPELDPEETEIKRGRGYPQPPLPYCRATYGDELTFTMSGWASCGCFEGSHGEFPFPDHINTTFSGFNGGFTASWSDTFGAWIAIVGAVTIDFHDYTDPFCEEAPIGTVILDVYLFLSCFEFSPSEFSYTFLTEHFGPIDDYFRTIWSSGQAVFDVPDAIGDVSCFTNSTDVAPMNSSAAVITIDS